MHNGDGPEDECVAAAKEGLLGGEGGWAEHARGSLTCVPNVDVVGGGVSGGGKVESERKPALHTHTLLLSSFSPLL